MNNYFANAESKSTKCIIKNKSKKALIIFGVKINPNFNYDLMQIKGISEQEIRTSIVKGILREKLELNQIEIIETNICLYTDDTELQYFLLSKNIDISKTNIGNAAILTIPAGIRSLKNTNSLSNQSITEGYKEGNLIFIESNKSFYYLDKESTLPSINLNTIYTLNSNNGEEPGRWIRIDTPNEEWSSKQFWYIDSDNGDDNNYGSSNSMIKTWNEFYKRTNGILKNDVTINLFSNTNIWPIYDKIYGQFKSEASFTPTIEINGGSSFQGPFGSAYCLYQNPNANEGTILTDTNNNYISLGELFYHDNLPAGWKIKGLSENESLLSSSNNQIVGSYYIANLMNLQSEINSLTINNIKIKFNKFNFSSNLLIESINDTLIEFNCCKLQTFKILGGAKFIDCYISNSNATYSETFDKNCYNFINTAFRNGYVSNVNQTLTFENCSFIVKNIKAITINANCYVILKEKASFWGNGLSECGIASLNFNSNLLIENSLIFGENIDVHFSQTPGSKILKKSTTIYLPGRPISDLSAIAPLTTTNQTPAFYPLTSWADFNANPFNGNLFNYITGSYIGNI